MGSEMCIRDRNKYPHVFNYQSEITDENALHQYTNATRLIRFLKLTIVIIFGLIVFRTIQNVSGNADGLGTWFLPLTLGMIFIPIIYFLMIRRPPRSTRKESSAASDVYKRQDQVLNFDNVLKKIINE